MIDAPVFAIISPIKIIQTYVSIYFGICAYIKKTRIINCHHQFTSELYSKQPRDKLRNDP